MMKEPCLVRTSNAGQVLFSGIAKPERAAWPKTLAEQARAVRAALTAQTAAVTAAELARQFKSARQERVSQLLETLCSLGQARETTPGHFVA